MTIPQLLFHRIDSPGTFGSGGDEILIEILDGGDIKVTTDPISGPNHMSAESFLRNIAELAGGTTTKARRVRSTTNSVNQDIHGIVKR
jgi:hypothetical protein